MKNQTVRVRYAPSPTGEQHIGGVRTALFNYLFARHTGGHLVLRVEDTDVTRSERRYEQSLYHDLRWLGLNWDEGPDVGGPYGPYRQSERGELYREAVMRLLDAGQAYLCYCAPEELHAERRRAIAEGRPPRYSGRCRDPQVRRELARRGGRPLVRYATPGDETLQVDDLVRGQVTFSGGDLGDFAIYRADDDTLSGGQALYNLAVVVDDHAMKITHVLRGEEHLPNTPRQMLLYRALGYETPAFGHLSLILAPDGHKMSKRQGDTSIAHYRREGYLPETLLAYIATLGKAPGRDPERLGLDELVERFDLHHLSASPSIYDPRRLEAFNRRRIRSEDIESLGQRLRPRLEEAYGCWERAADTAHSAETWYHILVEAVREEAVTLQDMVEISAFAYVSRVTDWTAEAHEAMADEWAPKVLEHCRTTLTEDALRTPLTANEFFREMRHHFRDTAGIRGRLVMFPIRAALTGTLKGPCLGMVTSLLGRRRCIERIEDVLA